MGQQSSSAIYEDEEGIGSYRDRSYDRDRSNNTASSTSRKLSLNSNISPKQVHEVEGKKVLFSDKISVVLIPSRAEFDALNLTVKLWWTADEFIETKMNAESEVVGALALEEEMSSSEAVRLLYQPLSNDGLQINHVLIVSHDSKFRLQLFHILKKASKKSSLRGNPLLIQQACSSDDLYEKLNICVDFNAVFIDKALILHTCNHFDLVEEVRSRHRHTCIVVVKPYFDAGSENKEKADFFWTLDSNADFHTDWEKVMQKSDRLLQPFLPLPPLLPSSSSNSSSPSPSSPASSTAQLTSIPSLPNPPSTTSLDEFMNLPTNYLDAIIFEDLSCLIVLRTPPYPITHVNAAWVNLCGYSSDEVIGQSVLFTTGCKTDPRKLESLELAIETGTPYSNFLINYHKEGFEFILYTRGVALHSPEFDTSLSYLCVFERIDQSFH